MISKILKEIDLNSAFTYAEKIVKLDSQKAKIIFDYTVNKSKRGFLNLSHAYLRWVDDFVDNPKINVEEKRKFIDRQKFLINSYKKGCFEEYQCTEEAILFHFICFGLEQNSKLILNAIEDMVDAIAMDIKRLQSNGIFSADELETYINKLSKALYDIIIYFFLPKHFPSLQNILTCRFQARTFMMRDLIEDIDAGFINISHEDIKKFNLSLLDVKEKRNLEPWIEAELKKILYLLEAEAEESRIFPFKFRIFMYYSHLYYLPKIYRLKVYRFNPNTVLNNRSIVKELQVYFYSFLIGLKLLRVEFIK